MKFITTLGILWLTIFSSHQNAYSQEFAEIVNFADTQFAVKNYQLAVKEYQRALFFSKGRKVDYLYRQIAHAFFANNQFDQASYFYQLSYNTAKADSIKNEILFNKVQCNLLLAKFDQSLIELINLPDSLDNYFNNKRNFYYAVTYFGLEKFKDAEKHFLALIPETNIAVREEIEKLFKKKKNLYRPNPKTARTLSKIIPGSGQFYSGDVKNGFNSLLLTGGFVTLGVFMVQDYTYLDAILTTLPWFLRYRKGGFTKAYGIALNKRAMRRNKTYKRILEIVEESKQQ
jgi:TM2 domain-containing membrane protein YozV